jgi:F0F1-type ATP synthase assembly protein I
MIEPEPRDPSAEPGAATAPPGGEPPSPSSTAMESKAKGSRDSRKWMTIGYEFAFGILVPGLLGYWADGWIGWRDAFPVLTVVGVFLGFGWGVWRLQRALGGRKPPRP